ncbi:hypothetical protein HCG77_31205, partial [Rhodococcus qingshengii]|nr:hypothetical protein [Rhodococcus qingshengii]
MALRKREQFALFELEIPESATRSDKIPEPDQPALFDVDDIASLETSSDAAEIPAIDDIVDPPDKRSKDVEPEPTPASERDATEPTALPPASEAADGHAVVVTAAGTYTPSGHTLTGPVDSIEKLDKLIRWATLTPLGA